MSGEENEMAGGLSVLHHNERRAREGGGGRGIVRVLSLVDGPRSSVQRESDLKSCDGHVIILLVLCNSGKGHVIVT